MTDVCVIDMQGFMVNRNEFIAKEVAVIHGKKQTIAYFVFMPTNIHPDVHQQYFSENIVHGIKWICAILTTTNCASTSYRLL